MVLILDGKKVRDEIAAKLAKEISKLKIKPRLVIIQVGNRLDSNSYINTKKKFGARVGVTVSHVHFPETVSRVGLVSKIIELNKDKNITGIIVQLPLPKNLDQRLVINSVDPLKDVDGITSTNTDRRQKGLLNTVWPATARGVRELLEFYKISLKNKKVCVVGRSEFVGTPIAEMCRSLGATVKVCHSKTPDLLKETSLSDVIISAVGKAGLIGDGHVRAGQIVVDIGISQANGKLVGDVNFDEVKNIVAAISPVPGGVGPMTVAALFENLCDKIINN